VNILLIILLSFIVGGCNATIGIPTDPNAEPWKGIYLFSFYSILIIPFVSVLALSVGIRQTPIFKQKLQRYLNISVIVIGVLWLLGEMSLTSKTNIRIDLLFTIPAIAVQISTVLFGWVVSRGCKATLNKVIKPDT
jgi:hypothetical protein